MLVKDGGTPPKEVWLGTYYQEIEVTEGYWFCLGCNSFGNARRDV